MGFDFFEGKYKISESFHLLMIRTLNIFYNEVGMNWIELFIFESKYGRNSLIAKDEKGDRICYDIKSLYNYIEKNHKI